MMLHIFWSCLGYLSGSEFLSVFGQGNIPLWVVQSGTVHMRPGVNGATPLPLFPRVSKQRIAFIFETRRNSIFFLLWCHTAAVAQEAYATVPTSLLAYI